MAARVPVGQNRLFLARFGGTHYMNPREVFVQLRYRFHY